MHPSGQLPAYEWDFSDVNPPVHAHAARRVYEIAREVEGRADTDFLEEVFHKLLLNFTWWVNRKDPDGRNAFQGGFLGLDNIGVFDRSRPDLPGGGRLEQADGTAWMGLFCLDMLAIALELTRTRPAYEAIATKFFEHFVAIAHAINGICGADRDVARGRRLLLRRDPRARRRAGAPADPLARGAGAAVRRAGDRAGTPWIASRTSGGGWSGISSTAPRWSGNLCLLTRPGADGHRLLAVADREKLERVLPRMLDPEQFLSDYGLRSMSQGPGRRALSLPRRRRGLRAGRVDERRCTAATRTGGARSGSRSTS